MKLTKIMLLLLTIMVNSVVAGSVSMAAGFSAEAGIITGTALSLIPSGVTGLRAGLLKEVWLADLMEAFIPDSSWLSTLTNMDAFVKNNVINLAEAGMAPDVLLNNTDYPVAFAEREDTPYDIVLDTYDTEGTVIRNAEQYELAYDKRRSIVEQHKRALLKKFAARAAYNIALDDSNSGIEGATLVNGEGSVGLETILGLKTWFDIIDAPDDRVLIMPPGVFNSIATNNLELLLPVFQHKTDLFGFKVFVSNQLPKYLEGGQGEPSWIKADFGALDGTNESVLAFCGSEVMRAIGTMDMFERLKDPEQKGDIINFQMRGIAMPKRQMAIATLIIS